MCACAKSCQTTGLVSRVSPLLGLLGVGSHVVVREFISYNGPHAYLSVLPTSSSYPLLAFSLFFFKFKGLKLHNLLLHTQLF